MKTSIAVVLFAGLLLVASAQNSSNSTNSSSSQTTATSSSAGAYWGMDCTSSKGNGNDVCAQVDKDWCCLYNYVSYAGVSTTTYTCTYSPDYYE